MSVCSSICSTWPEMYHGALSGVISKYVPSTGPLSNSLQMLWLTMWMCPAIHCGSWWPDLALTARLSPLAEKHIRRLLGNRWRSLGKQLRMELTNMPKTALHKLPWDVWLGTSSFHFDFVTCPCSSRTKCHDNLFVDTISRKFSWLTIHSKSSLRGRGTWSGAHLDCWPCFVENWKHSCTYQPSATQQV